MAGPFFGGDGNDGSAYGLSRSVGLFLLVTLRFVPPVRLARRGEVGRPRGEIAAFPMDFSMGCTSPYSFSAMSSVPSRLKGILLDGGFFDDRGDGFAPLSVVYGTENVVSV